MRVGGQHFKVSVAPNAAAPVVSPSRTEFSLLVDPDADWLCDKVEESRSPTRVVSNSALSAPRSRG